MLTALLGKQSQRGAGGLPVCPGIQANDEAVSTQWVWGGVKDVGSWAEKQPSKPPWLAALAFSASFPVGTVTAAGHPPPSPKQGHCLSSVGTLLEDSGQREMGDWSFSWELGRPIPGPALSPTCCVTLGKSFHLL